uniref:Uncharacterized protein n=1 Tax=Arundo donax TaxID=35708 RepID=A0A0A9AE30_ARUDO
MGSSTIGLYSSLCFYMPAYINQAPLACMPCAALP